MSHNYKICLIKLAQNINFLILLSPLSKKTLKAKLLSMANSLEEILDETLYDKALKE